MTYGQYYDLMIEDLDSQEKGTFNQYLLLKGEKGYLNVNEITVYKKLTFDIFILRAKSEEVVKLFRKGEISFNEEVDPKKLIFTVRHFGAD